MKSADQGKRAGLRRGGRYNGISRHFAFTMVEIMVVVVIVGILATMLVNGFRLVREHTHNSKILNDFRTFEYGFINYNMTHGDWPESPGPGILPSGMDDFIKKKDFEGSNYVKGLWVWEKSDDSGSFLAGISLVNPEVTTEQMVKVDRQLDDGNLSTGRFRNNLSPASYTLIIMGE